MKSLSSLPGTPLIPSDPHSEIREVLRGYPLSGQPEPGDIVPVPGGFSGAFVWRISTPSGPLALRRMELVTIEPNRLKSLHRLLTHISCRGFRQVAVPVDRFDGQTLVERGNELWQLEPWMPGVADFNSFPSESRLSAALTCLAHWHTAASGFVPENNGQHWFFAVAKGRSSGLYERRRMIDTWTPARCAQFRQQLPFDTWREVAYLGVKILDGYLRFAPGIAAELTMGLGVCVPLQPCLRDIWHDHVLFTGEIVTGLIDPFACRSDSVATDLARLLGSLVGDNRALWDLGIAAYAAVRPLSLEERALIELFDRSAVLLSGLTWLHWLCVERRQFARRDRVKARLEHIERRLAVLR